MALTNKSGPQYRTIRNTCLFANSAYLFLRLIYLVIFIVSKAYILIWVDVASILIYIACFFLIKYRKYYPYALLCGNEIFVFVITSTIMAGFNAGFHLYLIGLCVVSFFTTYFSKNKNIKGSIIWVSLSLAIYLTLYFVTRFNQPMYTLNEVVEMILFSGHAIIAFFYVAFYLVIFVKYTLSLEKKIMNESRTDELTQISNRYGLYDYFGQEDKKESKVLALFDIDDFKLINDEYGHAAGDYILKRVAELTVDALPNSFVCRYGGEEFVAVIDNDNCFETLETLRKRIEDEVFEFEGKQHKITITVGAASYEEDMSLEKWVGAADERMYFGKNSGKNKTVI